MTTDERLALVKDLRREHSEGWHDAGNMSGQAKHSGTCKWCFDAWPCAAIRAADALEEPTPARLLWEALEAVEFYLCPFLVGLDSAGADELFAPVLAQIQKALSAECTEHRWVVPAKIRGLEPFGLYWSVNFDDTPVCMDCGRPASEIPEAKADVH